ncbi:MAG: glycosyltransferase family A protein [Planctomycetota bacterium]
MNHATVSFVIPVRDGAAYLRESIESALQQSVPPLEVIVVDDGSTDTSAEIAESFGAPVRCERRGQAGQSAARNHGVSVARGEFVAFLDADDVAHADRLEKQLRCFAERPELQFCDAYTRNFWSPEIPEAERGANARETFTHGDAAKPRMIITWLARRGLFQRLGGFDEGRSLGEDTEWLQRVDRSDVPRHTLEEVLASRRLHHGNLTRRCYQEYLRGIVRDTKQRLDRARSATPTTSCVIPVFNGEQYIGAALESALAQSTPLGEIIVIDDGSTDDTGRVVAQFSGQVTYVRQENAGVSAARNRGVRESRGDFICFLDADDRYGVDKVRDQLTCLAADETREFSDGYTEYFWSEELSEAQRNADARYAHSFWKDQVAGHISTWMVRRRVFDRIGWFDETLRFSEDTDWLLRFKDGGGEVTTLSQCLSYRRLHPDNVTASHRQEQVRGLGIVFKRSRDRRQGAQR